MDTGIKNQILDLIHTRPQAIQEIALAINKNWRTADRYIQQLEQEDLIHIHVFRKGGRGALKVAYWPSSITKSPSAVKNFLMQRILNGTKKVDFSPLDIVQHVDKKHMKTESLTKSYYESPKNAKALLKLIDQAQSELQFFSGNLSFITKYNQNKMIELFRTKLQSNINIKILTRVDLSNSTLIKKLLKLNTISNQGKIHIRYAYQPLRCTIIDRTKVNLKENFIGNQKEYNDHTLLYTITDPQWIQWVANVFDHMWHAAPDAQKRIDVLENMHERKLI